MSWVRQRPCAVGHGGGPLCGELWLGPVPDRCSGHVEAHHAGERGLGRKAPDDTVIPLCQHHHRCITDRSGCFSGWPTRAVKTWELAVIAHCQAVYAHLVDAVAATLDDIPF